MCFDFFTEKMMSIENKTTNDLSFRLMKMEMLFQKYFQFVSELHCILSFEHARALQDISVHQCPGISYPTCQSPAAAVNSTSDFRLRQLASLMITKFCCVVVLSSCAGTSSYICPPMPWNFLPNLSKSCRSSKFYFKF